MRALCVYVDGGKGHFVPAKTVACELEKKGIDVDLEEFFDYLDIKWIGSLNKHWWRQMLRMPKFEQRLSHHNDADSNGMEKAIKFAKKHCERALRSNLEEEPIDFIFATHPYASTILSEMLFDMNLNIPVFYYATDVFNAPVASICDKLSGYFISTQEGFDRVKAMGQKSDAMELVPFPLQQEILDSVRLSKEEARTKLGLDPKLFTIQLNLGGEGIGSISVIKNLAKQNADVQIVVIGGMSKKTTKKLNRIASKLPSNVKLYIRGFISDVSTYLYASDVIVGRAGINTIVEAIYAHRPFIITELVYTVIPSADYIEKYNIGWNCANGKKNATDVLLDLINNPLKLKEIESNFNLVPIEFSPEKVADILFDRVSKNKKDA